MSGPNVVDDEPLFNSIVLAGKSSPGVVTLSGHDRKHEWDVKGGPALEGATTTLKSTLPIQFKASFYLVKDFAQGLDDFADWDVWVKVVEATIAGRTPKAVDVYHPDLARNGIKSVVKAVIGGFVYDGKGGATVEVTFQEYKPPKKKGGTPLGSQKTQADPNADVKKQLTDLTLQYQQTPWG